MGKALYGVFGAAYRQPVHFLGHSLGTLVTSYAVDYLHGTARSEHEVASPVWDSARTQVTLFDDAAIAKLIANESFAAGILGQAMLGPKGAIAMYLAEASQWKDPVPGEFAYLDNYFSCVGRYHAEGVNVLLQRAIWDKAVDPLLFPPKFALDIVDAHSVPASWYLQSISPDPLLFVGWKGSLGDRVLKKAPNVQVFDSSQLRQGMIYRQSREFDEWTTSLVTASPEEGIVPPAAVGIVLAYTRPLVVGIELARDLGKGLVSGIDGFLDWVGEQGEAGLEWSAGAARAVGDVAVEVVDGGSDAIDQSLEWASEQVGKGRSALLDTAGSWSLRIRLSSSGGRASPALQGDDAKAPTPAYLWFPVRIPAEAQWMSFEFQISGDGKEDALVMGINGTNRFELGTRFIGRDRTERSGLINVSDLAGSNADLFFGLVGGTSADCSITVSRISFRTLAPPTLTITQEGTELHLSWPASAPDWDLEATDDLTAATWQIFQVPPVLSAGRLLIRVDALESAQFFRLRQ
ncbi:MAG: hypothetical protein IT580_08075 [Verrucomicrobiales bacterium]|nr:hypothetical protein [Verrucomicrobiales bacterium]